MFGPLRARVARALLFGRTRAEEVGGGRAREVWRGEGSEGARSGSKYEYGRVGERKEEGKGGKGKMVANDQEKMWQGAGHIYHKEVTRRE
jgi:hypothetical protein